MSRLVINIPALNEEKSIVDLINNLPQQIEGIDEIIVQVIDDGSTDQTAELVKSQTNALVFSHGANYGVGVAFQTGVRLALENRADIMVNIDGDGQFDPADIAKLIKPIISNEVDFATGSRFSSGFNIKNMSNIKIWGNKRVASIISTILGKKFKDVSCGFRAFNKEALLNLNLFGKFTYVQESFLDLGFKGLRIQEVPIEVRYFKDRKSRVYKGAIHYALNYFKIILKTLRDYRALSFFGTIGLIVFLLGLVPDLFVFNHYIQTGEFSPYKAFGIGGLFTNFLGLTTFFLALIADMISRIRLNQEKMLYLEKKRHYYN